MDDHDFTLGINTNMQLLENINPSLDTGHEFTPLLLNNLSDRHDQQRLEFSFMPLLPDDTDNNPSFNFDGDHQGEPFFDPLPHFSTTKEDMVKSLSNFKPRGVTRENKANKTYSGKKRGKNSAAAKAEKPRGEVVHVRARRGEATDSHSLAERLRREKINRKLRSLQELVPGCYKTMGMSVMLEVTINYIRSLQSQIEFLSMKLTAASMFYDFNSAEMDAFDAIKETNGYEAQVMDTMGTAGEGYNIGNLLQFQSTWPL